MMSKLVVLLLFSAASQAQVFIAGGLAGYQNLGYRNPVAAAAAGIDIDRPRIFVTGRGEFARALKVETGDGWAVAVRTEAYARRGRLLIGAGNLWSREQTTQWTKAADRPSMGGGWDGDTVRFSIQYETPWLDPENRLQGPRAEWDLRAGKRWRVEIGYGMFTFLDTRVKGVDYGDAVRMRHLGAETAVGVKFYLGGF